MPQNRPGTGGADVLSPVPSVDTSEEGLWIRCTGPAAAFGQWVIDLDHPLVIARCWSGIAPEWAAGNTVVLKPAELTPLRLAELARGAGLLGDVFHVLPGNGSVVGARFVEHPAVREVVFTGSAEVDTQIMAGCAAQVKRVAPELDGKNSDIVFADAHPENAAATPTGCSTTPARTAACGPASWSGPASCTTGSSSCSNRRARERGGRRSGGRDQRDGLLISPEHRHEVTSCLNGPADAAFRGRRAAGRRLPTVALPRPADDRVLTEEIFRPIAATVSLETEADAIAVANDTELRLSGSSWTSNDGRAPRASRAVEARNLSVNSHSSVRYRTPFGGFRCPDWAGSRTRTRSRRSPRPRTSSSGSTEQLSPTTLEGATMSQRLNGRVAVITGGASGIGLASARRLAAEGARVVVADVDATSGRAAADEVGGEFVATDVTDESQVEALFQIAVDRFGSLDIAFNNAGISPPEDDSILTTGIEAWQKVQQVNLTSVYLCCKYAIPHMRGQGKGSVINTASFVAVMGAATSQISYTASKGGVLAMSRELGVQFARDGVRVNALCPGPVNTPLLRELFAKDPERAARRLVHVPMGRFAEPEEIAGAVAFLASDDSSFITASQFLVDGGIAGAYVTPL